MKTIFLIIICMLSIYTISCNDASVTNEELSETEVQTIFDSTSGTVITDSNIPKSKEVTPDSNNNILPKGLTTFAVLESDIPAGCTIPTTITQLNSGTDLRLYKFDKNMSASAAAMGFTGSIGKKQMLFIQDFIRYEMVDCGGGQTKKMGIGLRCFIQVTEFNGKIGYSKLPGIAANVELGRASCSFELKSLGFGIDGSVLADGLNTQGDYNVENFGKLAATFNNVLRLLNSNSTMLIRPIEVP